MHRKPKHKHLNYSWLYTLELADKTTVATCTCNVYHHKHSSLPSIWRSTFFISGIVLSQMENLSVIIKVYLRVCS